MEGREVKRPKEREMKGGKEWRGGRERDREREVEEKRWNDTGERRGR